MSFLTYLSNSEWKCLIKLSENRNLSHESKTLLSSSKYPCTSCLSRSENCWMEMPRIIFSMSSSVSLAPSIRVDAPVEVINTNRLRRPKTWGPRRAPPIHWPFNASMRVIFSQIEEGSVDNLWSSVFVSFTLTLLLAIGNFYHCPGTHQIPFLIF